MRDEQINDKLDRTALRADGNRMIRTDATAACGEQEGNASGDTFSERVAKLQARSNIFCNGWGCGVYSDSARNRGAIR